MASRGKFVTDTKEGKELYNKAWEFHCGNPLRELSSKMGSAEALNAHFDKTVSGLTKECVTLKGSRWSLHANEKQTPSRSVAGFAGEILFDILDCFCQWAANDTCAVSKKVLRDEDGEFTKILLTGPAGSAQVSLTLSPCTVPKKIERSRTDGIRIDAITWEEDCTLREFFGEENTDRMQETLLELWLQDTLTENKLYPYYEAQEEFAAKVGKIQEAAGKYLEEQEKLEKQKRIRKANEEEALPWHKAKLGEVIVTRPGNTVLDIGLVDSTREDGKFTVLARSASYAGGEERHYGGVEYCSWRHTGVFLTKEKWIEMSKDETTENMCSFLGIPYRDEEEKEQE